MAIDFVELAHTRKCSKAILAFRSLNRNLLHLPFRSPDREAKAQNGIAEKGHHLPHWQGTCRREPGTYHPTLYISCAEPRKQREESQTCLNYPESRPRKTIVNVPLEEVEKCLKEMDV